MGLAAMTVIWLRSRSTQDASKSNLLRPGFEGIGMPRPLLWACRVWYRSALRSELRNQPEEVLRDFGVTTDVLRSYLGRSFWEP